MAELRTIESAGLSSASSVMGVLLRHAGDKFHLPEFLVAAAVGGTTYIAARYMERGYNKYLRSRVSNTLSRGRELLRD